MEGTPLLDVMRGLILEPEAQADFAADPSGYMQRFGYDDVPEDDLREAVGLVADTLPPDVAHAVNTAADAEPGDGDSFGDGTVGLLGRISTAEVTESVVPDLDDLPPDDAGGFDDDLASDHDTTTFGEVTRDFDEDAEDSSDGGDGEDAGDLDATDVDDAADVDGDAHDDGGHDVSFGDGGLDDEPMAGDGPDAFGQGSAALDTGTESAEGVGVDDFSDDGYDVDPGDDAGLAVGTDVGLDEPGFDEPAPDDAFDGGFDADDQDMGQDMDYDAGDDPGDADMDGDVGQF
jgi:hypothetical protein